MLKYYMLQDSRITETDEKNVPVQVFINPDDNEKNYLINECKIDEHTLNSSLDPDELSRLEFEPDHFAIISKRPKNYSSSDKFLFKVSSIGFFLFKETLILVIFDDFNLFEGKIFNKVNSIQDLLLKILYRSIFHFLEHLKVINMISDALEDKINSSVQNKHLLNMFTLEKSLVYYMNAIHSNQMLIEKIKNNSQKFGFLPDELEFLDDIIVENNQCFRLSEIYSNILSGLMDARASIISNNLNSMMKNLNALVIAIAIPSFFAGMGGMSEFSNMIGFSHWKIGYLVFFLVQLGIGALVFFLIKKIEGIWKDKG